MLYIRAAQLTAQERFEDALVHAEESVELQVREDCQARTSVEYCGDFRTGARMARCPEEMGDVEFRLLAAVGAWRDGTALDLGHGRRRCVLAALLVDVNQAVSPDELIERAWGETGPQQGKDTLYAYLSRLRKVFRGTDVAGRACWTDRARNLAAHLDRGSGHKPTWPGHP